MTYRLQVDPDVDREAIDRVVGFHQEKCPVARSIGGSIDITTEMQLEDL